MELDLPSDLDSLFATLDPTKLSGITDEESLQWFNPGDTVGRYKCRHPNCLNSTSTFKKTSIMEHIIALHVAKDQKYFFECPCGQSFPQQEILLYHKKNIHFNFCHKCHTFLTYNVKSHKRTCADKGGEGKLKSRRVYEATPDISYTTEVTTPTSTTLPGHHCGHTTQAVFKRLLQVTFTHMTASHYLEYTMDGTKCIKCGFEKITTNPLTKIFNSVPLDATNFNINVLYN